MKNTKPKRHDHLPSIDTRCSDLPTLPTLQKLKRSISQPWILSSVRSARPFNHPTLSKLKKRKKPSLEITPILVQQVLKKYFVPIFEAQRHRRRNLKTSRTEEFSQSLSESLVSDLVSCEKTLNELKLRLEEIREDKNRKLEEVAVYKEKVFNLQGILCVGKEKKKEEVVVRAGYGRQESMYLRANERNKEEKELLDYESNRNLALMDKALVLEHWNSLFYMQSDIMGEQLKGLFFACKELSLGSLIKSFQTHKVQFLEVSKALEKTELIQSTSMYLHQKTIQHTTALSISKVEERRSVHINFKERSMAYKYDHDWCIGEIKKKSSEKELFFTKLNELDKKNTILEEEYEKTRKIIQDIKKKSKNYYLEEKVCRNCKKIFTERDNFNWSCRNHLSLWGQHQNYWCCGATDKEAPGCQLSKHISDEARDGKMESMLNKSTMVMCRNCKETGHSFKECYRDPNPRDRIGFRMKTVKRHTNRISYSSLAKLKSEEEIDSQEFSDIESARKEVVIEEFSVL